LHAYRLRLVHPISAAPLEIEAKLPNTCVDFLKSLEPQPAQATVAT
jgi:hypothetical protein